MASAIGQMAEPASARMNAVAGLLFMQVITGFMQAICQAIACQSRKTLGSRPSGMTECEGPGITKRMLTPECRPNAVIPAKAGIHFDDMNRVIVYTSNRALGLQVGQGMGQEDALCLARK
jgi:hypothetical protein